MKKTINDIYEIRTAGNTSAVEAVLAANEEAIRNDIIEIETKSTQKAVRARLYIDAANNIRFFHKTCYFTKMEHAEEAKSINNKSTIELFIFRHSDADTEHTSKEFAEEYADSVMKSIRYYITKQHHVILAF